MASNMIHGETRSANQHGTVIYLTYSYTSPPTPAKIRPHRRENRIHAPIPESIKAADRRLVQRPDAKGVQGGTGEIIPESMIFMKVVKNI